MDFLQGCPLLEKYGISLDEMSTQRFDSDIPKASAIDYTGSVVVGDTTDDWGNRTVKRQANFQLFLKQPNDFEKIRKNIAGFLFNFERWIDFCQFKGLIPKVGNNPDDEVMWADNGGYLDEIDGMPASLHMVQIHIQYEEAYK